MKRDLHLEVTNKIIKAIEAGNLPWESKREATNQTSYGLPVNAATKKPYRGINILTLWCASLDNGYSDLRFMTFKQAKGKGGSVRKGEKGHKIYFFKPLELEDRNDPEKTVTIPMLREFTVFHTSQIDGCEGLGGETIAPQLPEDITELAQTLEIDLRHGGVPQSANGMYVPSLDVVYMQALQSFKTPDLYRSTFFHEAVHWTGHKSRMNRDLTNGKGSQGYAREELVAELGAAFMCAEYGLDYTTRHAAYLSRYLETLKSDKRAIFQAASHAQKAVDWIKEKAILEHQAIAA